jgi:transposase
MQIKAEPIGDLALICRLVQSTNLSGRIDEYYPRHHLWKGCSVGKVLEALLVYILSENDHRLYRVEDWASNLSESLPWLLEVADFTAHNVNDDRLGDVLDYLSKDDARWTAFQRAHNEELIRLYDLEAEEGNDTEVMATVRIDSTTAQSHRPAEGIFQLGHNATGLGLPQIKMMLLAMDKANLPLAMEITSGEQSDDRLYTRALERAWEQGLRRQGMLVVGDSKLCNKENTSYIATSGNYYLGPLALRQYSAEELSQACRWIEAQPVKPERVMRHAACDKEPKAIALVKELQGRTMESPSGQTHFQRLIAVCSLNTRKRQLIQLDELMARAGREVAQRFVRCRGRKTISLTDEAETIVRQILDKHKVVDLFDWDIEPPNQKGQPCGVVLSVNTLALEDRQRAIGWRIMATNAPLERLSAQAVVLSYWEEYRIEQQFHLLLEKSTSLRPIFLKKQRRIKAMLNVLMLALQYYNLWQYSLRQELSQQSQPYLTHVIPGNPGTKVYRPTTTVLMAAFKNVQAIFIDLPDGMRIVKIQGITSHHLRWIQLLGLSSDTYLHPLCQ